MGVDKYTIIHPIFRQTIIQTSAFLVCCICRSKFLWNCRAIQQQVQSQPYESHSDFIKNRQAAMTTHWLHQLPTVGVDKYVIISTKSGHYTKSASWVSVTFLGATGRLGHDVCYHSREIKKVKNILIQAATSLRGQVWLLSSLPLYQASISAWGIESLVVGSPPPYIL